MQHSHRLLRNLGAQQRCHGAAHHPVELAADRRGDPDHQARAPTRGYQLLGRFIKVRSARGLRYEQQPGAGAGGRVGHPRNSVNVGAARRFGFDRRQVDHRVGFVGQPLQDGVAQRGAKKVHACVQAGVRAISDTGDRMSGSNQLPCDQPPDGAGGVGNQDVHLGSPPPTSIFDNKASPHDLRDRYTRSGR
jgi:hypothetical protein